VIQTVLPLHECADHAPTESTVDPLQSVGDSIVAEPLQSVADSDAAAADAPTETSCS
jgi:hypothetical protein